MSVTVFNKRRGLLVLAMLVLASSLPLNAQTNIAGPTIATDTVWAAQSGPYLVTGDVAIVEGATLTIEPGTVVKLQNGVDFVVSDGALVALGLSDQRIRFTSSRDTGVAGTPAQPGDWGSLIFGDGTNNAQTVLTNVDIRYGSGIQMDGASPTLNGVAIDDHAAPAIRMDLESSPIGSGLSAARNSINGIVVPSGQIDGDVVWALRGIPYVVEQGHVAVGAMAFGFTPNLVTLAAGVAVNLQLTIPQPAPSDGTDVTLHNSAPTIVDVPSPITFAEGQTAATVTVTGLEPSESRVAITASHAVYGQAVAEVRVINLPPLLLLPQQATIPIGVTRAFALHLPDPAPAGGVTVAVSSSCTACVDPINNVVVAEGQVSASFNVVGRQAGQTTLLASAPGYVPASTAVEVKSQFLSLPSSLIIPPGQSRNLTIELSQPAPSGGVVVGLTMATAGVATIPSSITVPANQTSAQVSLAAAATPGQTTLTADATSSGYGSASTEVVVGQFTLEFTEPFPASSNRLPQHMWEETKVRLNRAAPAGGLVVQLTNSAPGRLALNRSTVFIPGGQLVSATSIRLTGLVQNLEPVTVTASAADVVPASMAIEIVGQLRLKLSKAALGVGLGLRTHVNELGLQLVYTRGSDEHTYQLRRPLIVRVDNPATSRLGSPSELTIAPGLPPPAFRLEGLAADANPIALALHGSNFTAIPANLAVTVVTPGIRFLSLDNHRHRSGLRDNFSLEWAVEPSSFRQSPMTNQAIALSLVELDPVSPPIVEHIYTSNTGSETTQAITFSAGSFNTAELYVGQPTADVGSYKIQASSTLSGNRLSDLQRVGQYELAFVTSPPSTPIKFGRDVTLGCALRLEARLAGGPTLLQTAITVNLENPSPGAFSIPASVNLQSSTCIPVTGLQLTPAPVRITASVQAQPPPAHSFAPATFDVEVVQPKLALHLPESLDVGGRRGEARVSVFVNDPQENASVAASTTVALEIVDRIPTAMLVSFFDSYSGGQVVNSVQIAQGFSDSATVYPASLAEIGTFRVRASTPGFQDAVSDPIPTVIPQLAFSGAAPDGEAYVGRGLATSDIQVGVLQRCYEGADAALLEGVTVTSSNPQVRVVGVDLWPQGSGGTGSVAKRTRMLGPSTPPPTPSGGSCAYLIVEIEALPGAIPGTTVTLSASGQPFGDAQPLVVNVVEPVLDFVNLDGVRRPGGGRDGFEVVFKVVSEDELYFPHNYPLTPPLVGLEITNQAPPGLIAGIYDAVENGNEITSVAYGESAFVGEPQPPHTTGTYRVRATVAGYASATSLPQTIQPATVRLSHEEVHVGTGLITAADELFVEYVVGGKVVPAPDNVEISLSCLLVEVCTVSKTVTIPKGQSRAPVLIEGIGAGSTSLLVGHEGRMGVSHTGVFVAKPKLRFHTTYADAGESRQRLSVSIYVPGARTPEQHSARRIAVDLRVLPVDAGAVPGSVTIDAGASQSAAIEFVAAKSGFASIVASARELEVAEIEIVTR